jgi:catechol 2,3-dioxygenase-like lactoylglutathione lyase family enzyme
VIRLHHLAAALACPLILTASAWAQLPKAKDNRVVVGGIHIRPSSIDAQKKFWIDTLGGQPTRLANNYAAMFPDGIVEMSTPSFGCPQAAATSGSGTCEQKPWGGTKGTIINHVGLSVPNLRVVIDRVKAAGYPIVTRAELPPEFAANEKDGIAFRADHKANVSLVMGPDDILVELVEIPSQKAPVVFHHLHFEAPEVSQMIAWYSKVFGAKPGADNNEAVFPGATLVFSPARDVMVPTRGRVLDHFVFEIHDLDSYWKQLQDNGIKFWSRYAKPNLPLWGDWRSVFLPDPWGTYIELTEGAYKVH